MSREERIEELREILEEFDAIGGPDCGVAAYEYDKMQQELLELESK